MDFITVRDRPEYEGGIPEPGQHRASREEAEYYMSKLVSTGRIHRRNNAEERLRAQRVFQWYLIKAKHTQSYCALGYESFDEMLKDRFKASNRHFNRLVLNAKFHKTVFGEYFPDTGSQKKAIDRIDDALYIREGVTRPITSLSEDCWIEVWDIAKEIARTKEYCPEAADYHTGKITGVVTQEAVQKWKFDNGQSCRLPEESGVEKVPPTELLEQIHKLTTPQMSRVLDYIKSQMARRNPTKKK